MYTRCPTCSTCFRVTERHLSIAHGKVRCGQCKLVFNAPEHAIDDLPINQLTPTRTPQPHASSLDLSSSTKSLPTQTPTKTLPPVAIAPTTSEKAEIKTQEITPEESIEIEPVTKKIAPVFDSESTMIADISTLDKNDVENINLDSVFRAEDTINEDNDDDLFNDSFDLNAAIDELTQSSEEELTHIDTIEAEMPSPEEEENKASLPTESGNDVFHTDAYDATSASSVADIINEMDEQMSRDIAADKKEKTHKNYDANMEFDFLKLNDETKNKKETHEKNIIDEFGFSKSDDEEEEADGIFDAPAQEESFDIDIADANAENKNNIDEDELFNQIDLSDFEDSNVDDDIILEEPNFENSQLQNIGQHAIENDVPIQLRKDLQQMHSQHRWHPAITSSLIIFLLFISFSQLAYFRAHELVQQFPSTRPLLEAFCEAMQCKYSGPRDTKQIQLISRDVRLHPKEKKALLISAAMINNAYFSQPYPDIHIRLSDISGNVVAERIFSSKTYMGKLSNPFLLMKSKTPVHINFEVVDPGKDAINFEFTFL